MEWLQTRQTIPGVAWIRFPRTLPSTINSCDSAVAAPRDAVRTGLREFAWAGSCCAYVAEHAVSVMRTKISSAFRHIQQLPLMPAASGVLLRIDRPRGVSLSTVCPTFFVAYPFSLRWAQRLLRISPRAPLRARTPNAKVLLTAVGNKD
jgi:hypothetical protein